MEKLLTVTIQSCEKQGDDILVLELVSDQGVPLPQAEAGSHIDLHINESTIRQYSLCQSVEQGNIYRLGILKDPSSRGGSKTIHDTFAVGQQLTIGYPKNLFPLNTEASHSVLISGGIGITPILSMAYALEHENSSFELYYCGRDSQKVGFVNELREASFQDRVTFLFHDCGCDHKKELPIQLKNQPKDAHYYICGPLGFIEWVEDVLNKNGVIKQNIHKELFATDLELGGEAFEIECVRSQKNIQVSQNESILEALAREGIKIEKSCEQGICGACLCDVLEGEPDHRDVYLTDEEKESNELILVCCSRSKTEKLVLDI